MWLMLTAVVLSTAGAPPEIWSEIEKLHAQIQDAQFTYKGEYSVRGREAPEVVRKYAFEAKAKVHFDGVMYYEYLPHYERDGGRLHCRSVRKGGRARKLRIFPVPKPNGVPLQESNEVSIADLSWPFGTFYFWPVSALRCTGDDIIGNIVDLGNETVDGRPCRVLKLYYGKPRFMPYIFYFDMQRGGQVLRMEWRSSDERRLIKVMHSVELQEIDGKDGNKFWFPVGSVVDTYADYDYVNERQIHTDRPNDRPWHYRVDPSTIKINAGLDPKKLEAKL